ncbi:T9SS type A sorting domain-containing protein [Mariniflexile sp. HMF6888]|uniref:T9SS type A sorting domain-containing protein n=1 Tax=Mariniflexile sp. HMF6888 TaxID=3373086 RepID=UPI00379A97E0
MKKHYFLLFTILFTSLSFGQITLKISGDDAPASGSTVIDDPETVGNATIDFITTNFNVGEPGTGTEADGYVVWEVRKQSDNSLIDGGNIYTANDFVEYPISGLSTGATFNLRAELVDNTGAALSPEVVYTLTVTISEYIDVANLAALRTQVVAPDSYYRVTGQVINTHTIATGGGQTMYFQDGSAGIKVYDENYETSTYDTGDAVTNIRGYLENMGGELQFVPTYADWGAPNSTGNVAGITTVTVATLTGNWAAYESELVKISDVTFADAGGTFMGDTNYTITDASGSTTFSTEFSNSNYLSQSIPSGGQDLIAIVTGSSVTSRHLDDISATVLSIKEFNTKSLSIYPNPTSLDYVSLKSKSGSPFNVTVFDSLGKQVLNTTLTDGKLNVSSLNIGLYIMKVSQDKTTVTKKLVVR